MSSLFASPTMLWWAGAAAVPVLIHLLSRRRYRRVPWAAMDFLNRAFKRTRKRLRIENLLLMLLRAAVLLLLAMALANPRTSGSGLFGGVGGGSKNVVFVVDTSFSMDVRDATDESAFAKARQMALQVLEGLDGDGDAAALLTTGSPAHLLLPLTRELGRVRAGLETMTVSHGATDTLGGLKVVSGLLQEPEIDNEFPGKKTVYFFTDLQKTALLDPAAEPGVPSDTPDATVERLLREIRDAGGQVTFVDVGHAEEERSPNVAVTRLTHEGKTLVSGVQTEFECRLENFGDATAGGELQFYVDDESSFTQRERVIDLKGRATGTEAETEVAVTFRAELKSPGWHYVAVRYVDDLLKIDNVRRHAFYVRDRIRVLAVNGTNSREPEDSATFFAARALDPHVGRGGKVTGSFHVKEVSVLDLQSEDLGRYDLVVLANVAQPSAAKVAELERFVKEGGAVLIFLGRSFEVSNRIGPTGGVANGILYKNGTGLLPGRMVKVIGSDQFTDAPYHLQFETFDHPAMAYFEDPKISPGVTRMPVHKFVEVEIPADREDVRVLASFRHADTRGAITRSYPALIEKTYGKGRVELFTSSADKTWNLYGATPAFVPLMKELAYHLTRRPARNNLVVGENLVERFPPSVTKVMIREGDRDEVERATTLSPDQSTAEVALPRLERATVIRLRYDESEAGGHGADATRIVTVNVDPVESDLTRGGEAWLTAHFGTELLNVVDDLDELAETAQAEADTGLWKTLLYVVLGFLVVETILAWRFGRQYGTEAVAA